MKLKNLTIAAIYVLGGPHAHARSFEETVEAVGAALGPGMNAFHDKVRAGSVGLAAVAAAHSGGNGAAIGVGKRVFHSSHGAGRVEDVFANGTAQISFYKSNEYQFSAAYSDATP